MLTRRRLLHHELTYPPSLPHDAIADNSPDAAFFQAIATYGLTTSSSHDLTLLRSLFDEIGEAAFAMSHLAPRTVPPNRPLTSREINTLADEVRSLDREAMISQRIAEETRAVRRQRPRAAEATTRP